MNLGSLFAIFVTIAFVLLILFCLILKYYDYQLKKKKNMAAYRYQDLSDNNEPSQTQNYEGAYEQYCQRKAQYRKSVCQIPKDQDEMINCNLKRQITRISSDFYGLSAIRQRLNQEYVNPFDRVASQPLMNLKSQLSLCKLNTNNIKAENKPQRNVYDFVKRLVSYDRFGIALTNVEVQTLTKKGYAATLKKKVEQTFVQSDEKQFQMYLDTCGLQLHAYCFSKVVCQVDMSKLKDNYIYSFKSLQIKQYKQDINQKEYQSILRQHRST